MNRTTFALATALLATLITLPAWALEDAPDQRPPGFPKPDIIVMPAPPQAQPPAPPAAPSNVAADADSRSASYNANDIKNDLSSRDRFLSLSFASPAWATVPQPYGCIVSISRAWSALFGAASYAKAKQVSEHICSTIRMAETATEHCQYRTAAHLNQRAYMAMYGGEEAPWFFDGNPQNLHPQACEELKRPQLRPSPTLEQ